jgi:hypothetical protein
MKYRASDRHETVLERWRFPAPPVCTVFWDGRSWARWIIGNNYPPPDAPDVLETEGLTFRRIGGRYIEDVSD